MDLTWIVAAIAGCVALAVCIALVLLRPMDAERRHLRPLANVGRLTRLPEYVRAKRARTRDAVITMALLVVMFAGAVIVSARPTGLPTSARQSDGGDPEDIMLCIGAPLSNQAVTETLRYFADRVDGFGTQRIGLTSPNRRVVPLTRDYQYAKAAFANYAGPAGSSEAFSPTLSYVDYAESVEDQLALCLTGFPDFDRQAAQRRSVIYVGPGELRSAGERRPALFDADRVRVLALAAGVQVNALVVGPQSASLTALTRDTGGQSLPADSAVTLRLNAIRDSPPEPKFSEVETAAGASIESPDIPLAIALAAALALTAWSVVRRR
ncbi:hypothetical protein [Mycolicibacterium hodleri]|uniref:VWA domain-containing protein n=1 Tax=Mycolicibacterium hodleri TaxID=49897 RepID=A0A502DLK8_9MYCO|nr:hypothetical protein [Mycolicibacterium hodleri]TPG25540.1 hypothetical protein EAH80_30510 [Mycolicibacterium hodleri]